MNNNDYIQWDLLVDSVDRIFASNGWVMPTPQDAATFVAQEAHEVIDIFLREKTYVRNHQRDPDTLNTELAHIFMMWVVTCKVSGVNGFDAFSDYYREVVCAND
jgi:NTP pyrophosphatase (non-canonical NTP hydrolase)